jgi:opacity protein-like surface antigen
MSRCATAALLTVLASTAFAPAADQPAKAEKTNRPTGTWTRTFNEFTVSFKFEGRKMVVEVAKSDAESLTVHTAYSVTDDGVLFGYTTQVDKKGTDEGPEKGDLFSFAYKIDGDAVTISDLNGSKPPSDAARQLIQGEYKRLSK